MPIQLNWKQQDPPILHYTMVAPWSWDQFFEAVTESRRLMDSGKYASMDMIIEWDRMPKFPPHMLTHISNLFQRGQSRSKHVEARFVTVATPSLVRTIVETLMKIYPRASHRVLFANSVDEALALLQQRVEQPPETEAEAI